MSSPRPIRQRPVPPPAFVPALGLIAAAALLAAAATPLRAAADEVDVITVTATGRERGAQDVPISVTAFDATTLERAGVTDVKSLVSIAPALNVNRSNTETGGATIRLRGVGTTGNNAGLEGSVGVFVDGVYLSRPGIAFSDLVDIQRIEILRGPQGTLFGRNTSAGAIDIKTNKPDLTEFLARTDVSYGNFDDVVTTAIVNVPVAEDVLGLRFAGSYHSRDGFLESRIGSIESNDRDRFLLRGQALWEPTDRISVRMIGDYFEANEKCCDAPIAFESAFIQGLFASPLGMSLFPSGENGVGTNFGPRALRERRTNANRERENDQDQWGISTEVTWDLDLGTLTYIGSYREWDATQAGDDDFTANDLIATRRSPQQVDLVTQEIRLRGEWNWIDWLFGAYYSNEAIDTTGRLGLGSQYENYVDLVIGGLSGGALDTPTLTGNPSGTNFSLGTIGDNDFSQRGDAWALFTHNVFEIGEFVGLEDRLHLTAGLRYNWERKKGRYARGDPNNPGCDGLISQTRGGGGLNLTGALSNTAVGLICFPFVSTALPSFRQTFQDDQVTGTTALSFDISEDIMTYVSYSRGFKAGGFNLDSTAAIRNFPSAATIPANPANDADPGNFLEEGDASFDSEVVDAYEIGIRSDLFGRRLRANLTGFWYDIEDFQVLEFTGVSFVTDNVKEVRVRGFELETIYHPPVEGLEFTGSVVYSDAQYGTKGCTFDPTSLIIADKVCGKRLTNAPPWVVNLGGVLQRPLVSASTLHLPEFMGSGDVLGLLALNYQWRDKRRAGTTLANVSPVPGASETPGSRTQEANYTLDLRVALTADDHRWSVEGWARNVTDRRTSSVRFAIPLRTGATGGFLDEPRTYGFTVRAAF